MFLVVRTGLGGSPCVLRRARTQTALLLGLSALAKWDMQGAFAFVLRVQVSDQPSKLIVLDVM